MSDLPDVTTATHRVLIVDDDNDMLALLSTWLRHAGLVVSTAASGAEALSRLNTVRPHCVLTDLYMEGMDGMTLLTEIHQRNPLLPVLMLSGQASVPEAVKAMHLGISAFLTKPVEREVLIDNIKRALRLSSAPVSGNKPRFGEDIVYRSARMAELLEQAELVADSDVTVFISGQTGTGKEVLAKAIHQASPRRDKPFVGINCGAIPEQLLESELFGHEKGAFTGANMRHEGLFQAADGGTLFLDEIGDMPLGLQVKLLRVLQDFEVRPVGSTRSVPINVRVISATHQDLAACVARGEFREDLYYRLNVVPLHMPRLLERREDIPALIDYFLERQAQKRGTKKKRFAPEAMEYLLAASWPGNVRQLHNVVELCTILSKTDIIPLTLARTALREEPGGMKTLKDAKAVFEKDYLAGVLRAARGQVSKAARMAGRNRTEFYKLLGQHGLNPADFRGDGGQEPIADSEPDDAGAGELPDAESTADDSSPD
ncbi:MAG TPA: sigma-54 dependent transcriptional regulator [Gammaproteobacteria bacterium]|nr:sigma-54 dependent transcriptional regulator [Gammaproteobacteria bacterium]